MNTERGIYEYWHTTTLLVNMLQEMKSVLFDAHWCITIGDMDFFLGLFTHNRVDTDNIVDLAHETLTDFSVFIF